MSFCSFIATNYEMPEVASKVKSITVKEAIELGMEPHKLVPWDEMDPDAEILFVENEEDLNELVITKDGYYDVSHYTSSPFIYEVSFIYSESRVKQLLAYLKENCREGQIVELWGVWIGDEEQHIPHSRCSYEELSLDHLMQLYNSEHEKYKDQQCIVFER